MNYFSKKTIKFKSVAATSLWLLYTATISLLLIVFLGWYFFLFRSLAENHIYYVNQLPKLQETIDHLKRKQNDNAKLNRQLHELKTNRTEAINDITVVNDRIQRVFDLINNAQLLLVSFTPDKEINKEWYLKKTVNYAFKGSYINLLSFFENLAKLGLYIQCKQLTINKIEDGLLQASARFDFIEFKGC